MVAAVVTIAVAIAMLALVVAAVWRVRSSRRLPNAEADVVQRRIAELRALPAPDELPRAPDLTPGMRRKLRRREHPIAHKRSGRRI